MLLKVVFDNILCVHTQAIKGKDMSKLIKASLWAKETFEAGSAPTIEKVTQWILSKDIPGRVISGESYVYADRFALSQEVDESPELTGIDLLVG